MSEAVAHNLMLRMQLAAVEVATQEAAKSSGALSPRLDLVAQVVRELVYDSCTEYSRCSMVYPMGINIARGVNVMREALSAAGLAPLELMAVAREQAGRGTVFGGGPAELAGVVQTLRGQGIAIPLDETHADVMLVTTVIDVLLFQDALAVSDA